MAHERELGLAAAVSLAVAVACGCSTGHTRASLEGDPLRAEQQAYMLRRQSEAEATRDRMLRRMEAKHEAYTSGKTTEPPEFNVLVLSGGGDYGAFGAGFLKGWAEVSAPGMTRPVFDVVSGVSTGALIAPFAFVGDTTSYDQVLELYREPKEDWFSLRGLFFFLPGNESFLDNAGLARDVGGQVDIPLIERIAAGHRQDRVLQVGATNLDFGTRAAFSMGPEAVRAVNTRDLSRFHSMLMASAAIPAAFPPVEIDDHLYADGGITANILCDADIDSSTSAISAWRRAHPGKPLPRVRFWVIINNQLCSPAVIVQPAWPKVTASSLSAAIRSSTTTSLKHLMTQCALLRATDNADAVVHWVSIPDGWVAPVEGTFKKETMQSLTDLGLKMGADAASWRTELPD